MLKILLLEDDDFFRKAYLRIFKRTDYEVIALSGGEDAINIFNTEKPDIVITDILMPVVDGLTVINEIRKFDQQVPIIAASGGGKSILPDLCLDIAERYGADAMIEKPFNAEELLETIKKLTGS